VFRPILGGSIKLCSADKKQSEVWSLYEQLISQKEQEYTISVMISEFFGSADFHELSKTTQADYRKQSKPILLVFGKMKADAVGPQHVRAYLDKRGLKSRVQANREKAFFSRSFRWAYERGKVKMNPCKGVKQFKERARTRYITDEEYRVVYDLAPNVIKVAMEVAYLCLARRGDILALRWEHVLDEGVFIQQSKTAVKQIKLWSPRLRDAINMARELCKHPIAGFVISKPDGQVYTTNGFDAAWQKTMREARARTGLPLDFTFHDLKAKGISDLDGSSRDKQQISGHKTEAQVQVYDRSIKRVPTVETARKK
jgi:integrase